MLIEGYSPQLAHYYVASKKEGGSAVARQRRVRAASDIYHVIVRGVGRQLIFEDDNDRQRYMMSLSRALRAHGGMMLAWCLMGNHAHFLVHMPAADLSEAMHDANGEYARYFNTRHDRVGHLFQDRFTSIPVETDEQLLTTVRYIHRNPDAAGIASYESYPWSSYREYVDKAEFIDPVLVTGLFGTIEEFVAFHCDWDGKSDASVEVPPRHLRDEDLIAYAQHVIDGCALMDIKALPRKQRDVCVRKLRSSGLTIKQIERLTSLGRNIIARA